MGDYVKSRPSADRPACNPQAGPGHDMLLTHPALWEYLTMQTWEDGTPRETATVSIFVGSGGLQAALNDRDVGRVAFVTGTSLAGLLDALETGLQNESLDWRVSRSGPAQKKRK